jgi:hypothetical protein
MTESRAYAEVETERSVADYPDAALLERAVRNGRGRGQKRGQRYPRWSLVADTFALGSTYAIQLCRRFGLDPDELVTR